MNQQELDNDWSRVQEMFGSFARPQRIAHEARLAYAESGRGAVFFYLAQQQSVLTYATPEWITESIQHSTFQSGLLKAIASYNPATQAIVLVTFDDIFLSPTLDYSWFGVTLVDSP